jgi:hypothetical protein
MKMEIEADDSDSTSTFNKPPQFLLAPIALVPSSTLNYLILAPGEAIRIAFFKDRDGALRRPE